MASESSFKFSWKRGVDIPCPITWCKTTAIDETIYLADLSDRLKVFKYLPNKDEWAFLADDNPPPSVLFGMAVVNGRLMLAGGEGVTSKKPVGVISVLDDDAKKWSQPYPEMANARVDAYAIGWGKYLVVAGGRNGTENVSTVEVLDTEGSIWLPALELPEKMAITSLAVFKDSLYISGGSDKVFTAPLSKLTSGDTSASPWKPLPNTPHRDTTLFVLNNQLLCAGGLTVVDGLNTAVTDIYAYDGATQWNKVGDLPEANVGCCCNPFSPSGGLLVVGGKAGTVGDYLVQSVNIGRCN